MTTIYIWDSPKKANEVLETILYMTEKERRINPFACTHKLLNKNEVAFTLWHDPFLGGRASFNPPSLKGTIKGTTIGCTISAEVKFIMAYIDNCIAVGMMLAFYIMGFASIFAGFHLSFIPSILFFLLAIGATSWFIYTYKKHGKLKVHLEIMNSAASVGYQIISL